MHCTSFNVVDAALLRAQFDLINTCAVKGSLSKRSPIPIKAATPISILLPADKQILVSYTRAALSLFALPHAGPPKAANEQVATMFGSVRWQDDQYLYDDDDKTDHKNEKSVSSADEKSHARADLCGTCREVLTYSPLTGYYWCGRCCGSRSTNVRPGKYGVEQRGLTVDVPVAKGEKVLSVLVSSLGMVFVGTLKNVSMYRLADLFRAKSQGWSSKKDKSRILPVRTFFGHHDHWSPSTNVLGQDQSLIVRSTNRILIWNLNANVDAKQPYIKLEVDAKLLATSSVAGIWTHATSPRWLATSNFHNECTVWKMGARHKSISAKCSTTIRDTIKGMQFSSRRPYLYIWTDDEIIAWNYIKSTIVWQLPSHHFVPQLAGAAHGASDASGATHFMGDHQFGKLRIMDVTECWDDHRYLLVAYSFLEPTKQRTQTFYHYFHNEAYNLYLSVDLIKLDKPFGTVKLWHKSYQGSSKSLSDHAVALTTKQMPLFPDNNPSPSSPSQSTQAWIVHRSALPPSGMDVLTATTSKFSGNELTHQPMPVKLPDSLVAYEHARHLFLRGLLAERIRTGTENKTAAAAATTTAADNRSAMSGPAFARNVLFDKQVLPMIFEFLNPFNQLSERSSLVSPVSFSSKPT